jgi:hypothetical protein
MVKNSFGGNKAKGHARKDNSSSHKIRLSSSPLEIYAKVVKLFGGNRCDVITINGDSLSCVIRGKFSGKFKHSNIISINSFVLVGLHDWASDKSISDLLFVYQHNDLSILSQFNPSFFDSSIIHTSDFTLPYSFSINHNLNLIDNNNLDNNNDLHNDLHLDLHLDLDLDII